MICKKTLMMKLILMIILVGFITYLFCLLLVFAYNIITRKQIIDSAAYLNALIIFTGIFILEVTILILVKFRNKYELEQEEVLGGTRGGMSHVPITNNIEDSDDENPEEPITEYTSLLNIKTGTGYVAAGISKPQVFDRALSEEEIRSLIRVNETPNDNNDVFPPMMNRTRIPDDVIFDLIKQYLTIHKITSCQNCGTLLLTEQFGDYECSHCGQKFRLVSL